MYMPLLMIAIILTVQAAFVYLGNQVVSAAAREASRTARITADPGAGEVRGRAYADNLGRGMISGVDVSVTALGEDQMRTVVSADAVRLLPFFGAVRVTEEVQGPVERFVEDVP
ncbi:hypothetical protein FHE65_23490 [Mumia zhuanghuii]|jgi:Flp pilus assembly protein TadG|uniref:TadE-like domain-containing protein n=3 Tax=Mumia zhuanghuii TaxID=2585211 RepID=A0A5C4MFV9_9ACTN|nr:hypothetical protein FHE65_23490 [Mumia zhuanghuii]